MLSFDVSVPQFGETIQLPGYGAVIGNGKQVAVTILDEGSPRVAFVVPAEAALDLSQRMWSAARQADPESTSLIAALRRSFAGNA
jgi:hypothetical protein